MKSGMIANGIIVRDPKGHLIAPEGTLRYREYEEDGQTSED
jgi:hypothetical protein